MNFEINEQNNNTQNEKSSNIMRLVIILGAAIVVGLIVFLVTNSIFNSKKTPTPKTVTSEKRSLTESNVKILYDYVTYGTEGIRNDKFVKEKKVTASSFTDEEKIYYALQFAQASDFTLVADTDDTNKTENKDKAVKKAEAEYYISSSTIKKFVEKFFGKNVKYNDVDKFTYQFDYTINDEPVDKSTLTYSSTLDGYVTTFKAKEIEPATTSEDEVLVDPYIGKLVEAWKDPDGSYRLIEKVIYPVVKKQADGKYEISIYSDYDHTNVIESSVDKDISDIGKIKIDKYIKNAATVTYTFKLNGMILYFDSSKIS